MYCKNCGAQLDENAAYCSNCGQATAPNVAPQPPVTNGEAKSKLVAGLLGILVGSLGIHNFYLGFTSKAVAQLLITVLTCGIGSIATSIWGLVEGILILVGNENHRVDANGVPLKD